MKYLFRFISLTLYMCYLAMAFDCQDLTQKSLCDALLNQGCSWDGTKCTGNFAPYLLPPACYYIDSLATATTYEGTPQNPLRTLTEGLDHLSSSSGSLIIIVINHIKNIAVNIDKLSLVNTDVTIMPLFSENKYFITLDPKLNTPVPRDTGMLTVEEGKVLTIIGARLSYTLQYPLLFSRGLASRLVLEQVDFIDCYSKIAFPLIYEGYGNFDYTDGQILNTTAYSLFNIRGQSNVFALKNIKIIDTHLEYSFMHCVADYITLDFSNIYARGGNFQFVGCEKGCSFFLKDSTLEKGAFTLFSAKLPSMIDIFTSNFRDLIPSWSLIRDVSYTFIDMRKGRGNSVIQDTSFSNISVKYSLLLFNGEGAQLSISGVNMIDIKKAVSSSPLVFEDNSYLSEWPGGLCCLVRANTQLKISGSNFKNIASHCLALKDSSLEITSSTFDNTNLDVPSAPCTTDLQNTLDDRSGVTWISIQDTRLKSHNPSQIILQDNEFINNRICSKYAGAIRIKGVLMSEFHATFNKFAGNEAIFGGAIYVDNDLLRLTLANNLFENNLAVDGGVIYKTSREPVVKPFSPSVSIQGDTYIENTALRSGGAIYLNWESLSLDSIKFIKNNAIDGGAIYFPHLDQASNVDGYLRNIEFNGNTASRLGGAIKLLFDYSLLNDDPSKPSTFVNNIDAQNQAISTRSPAYYVISFFDVIIDTTFTGNKNLTEWIQNPEQTIFAFSINTSESNSNQQTLKHKSGTVIPQIIKIDIMDDNHQLASYINDEEISIQLSETKNNISDFEAYLSASHTTFPFNNGSLFINNEVRIVGEPKTTATLNIRGVDSTSYFLKESNTLLNVDIELFFSECEIGDIFSPIDRTCEPCGPGTYSLVNPYETQICLRCEANAQCLGGAKIAPKPGYWRHDASSPRILKCPASEACSGGFGRNKRYVPKGVCKFPHIGNLCNTCAVNYAKFGSSKTCDNCNGNTGYYIKSVGFFLLKLATIIYLSQHLINKKARKQASLSIEKDEKNKQIEKADVRFAIFKIVISFIQISSLIVEYQSGWPSVIVDFIGITNKLIPTGKDGMAVDCIIALLAKNNENINFIRLVFALLQPFVLFCVCLSGYLLYLLVRKTKGRAWKSTHKIWDYVFSLTTVIIFVLQPHIIQVTLELFRCQNLKTKQNPLVYMADNSGIECWSPLHLRWSLGVGLPFFVIFGVIIPLLCIRKVMKSSKSSSNNTKSSPLLALMSQGLKSIYLYWELATLAMKILVIICYTCLTTISSPRSQAFIILLPLWFSGLAQLRLRPYLNRTLNNLGLFALINLGLMSLSNVYFVSNEINKTLEVVLDVLIPASNACFYLLVAFYWVMSYRGKGCSDTKGTALLQMGTIKKKPTIARDIDNILQEVSIEPQIMSNVLKKEPPRISQAISIESQYNDQLETPCKEKKTGYFAGMNELIYPNSGSQGQNIVSSISPTQGLLSLRLESPGRPQSSVVLNKDTEVIDYLTSRAFLSPNRTNNEDYSPEGGA